MDFVSTTQILLKRRRNKVTVPVFSHFQLQHLHCTWKKSRTVKSLAKSRIDIDSAGNSSPRSFRFIICGLFWISCWKLIDWTMQKVLIILRSLYRSSFSLWFVDVAAKMQWSTIDLIWFLTAVCICVCIYLWWLFFRVYGGWGWPRGDAIQVQLLGTSGRRKETQVSDKQRYIYLFKHQL